MFFIFFLSAHFIHARKPFDLFPLASSRGRIAAAPNICSVVLVCCFFSFFNPLLQDSL